MIRYRFQIGVLWMIVIGVMIYTNIILIKPLIEDFSWLGFSIVLIILGIVDVIMISMTVQTYYEFHDDYLCVQCGFFCHEEIPYQDVRSFKETHNPLSSMGLSLDRIDIIYKAQKGRNGNSEVLISPVKKQEFIKELEKRTKIFITK